MNRRFTRAAKGRKHQIGEPNPTELRYAELLESRRIAGEVEWFRFEAMKFRIGAGAMYSPDYAVMLSDGSIELHEVKAGMLDKKTGALKMLSEEASKVRVKVAADQFPFRFLFAVERPKKSGGGFEIREVN